MTDEQKEREASVENGRGHIFYPITDESGYELGGYELGCYGKCDTNDIYVFVTNDCGVSVFFLHTNSVEKACGAIIAYAQMLKTYSK